MIATPKDHLELWELFKSSLAKHYGDSEYDAMIRQNGFEIKNMIFHGSSISFSIVTSHIAIIPYTILAGGYQSSRNYIEEEIKIIRNTLMTAR